MRSERRFLGFSRGPVLALAVAAVGLHGGAAPATAKNSLSFETRLDSLPAGNTAVAPVDGIDDLGFQRATDLLGEGAGHRGSAVSDVTARNYVGNAGTGLFSSGANWDPSGTPVAGDNLTFGSVAAVSYSVTNDLAPTVVLGDLIVDRGNGAPVPTTTLSGGFNGNRIQVTTGGMVINGGTISLASDHVGDDSNTFSIRVGANPDRGSLLNNTGSLTINNGAKVTYGDIVNGSYSGTGTVIVSGAGTTLTPLVGASVYSEFTGGNTSTSTVVIDSNASVTTNVFSTNTYQTTTVSNGATLTSANYDFFGPDPKTGVIGTIHYGGEVLIGYATYDPTKPAPLSTLNVNSGGTVNATFTYLSGAGIGQEGDANINGGTLNAGDLTMSVPISGNANANINTPASFNHSTLHISNNGVVHATSIVGATVNTGTAVINVDSGGNLDVSQGQILLGGLTSSGDVGTGSSDLNILSGGTVTCGQLGLGDYTAANAAANYSGNNVSVSGAGSKLTIIGIPAVPETTPGAGDGTEAYGASIYAAGGTKHKSTISVLDGGEISMLDDSTDPNQNGALYLSNGSNAVGVVTVDGAGSVLNAGTALGAILGSGKTGFSNARATINVTNGGTLFVHDDLSSGAGEIALGLTPSTGALITVNIGGGTSVNDGASVIDAEGAVLVGGYSPNNVPTKGVVTNVNINNGRLEGLVVAVFQGSTINLNKGELTGSLLGAEGGSIKMSSTAPAGTGVMFADTFEAQSGGTFDIGNSGGVSQLFDATDTDLSEIKTLITAGLTGGTNSIRSDLVTAAGSNLAIGYYLRAATSPRSSFLGVDLDSDHSYVLFRVTLKGDADLTGTVNFDDLVILAQNYNTTGKEWYQGDFTHDGIVNFDDLVPLAQNYNAVRPGGINLAAVYGKSFAADWAFAQSLVPEPTSLAVMATGAAFVGRRRR